MNRTLEYYQGLPYTRRAEGIQEGDGPPYWVAWIDELSGCKTDGATYAEAMANLDVAFDDYIEAMLEFHSDIPLPKPIKRTSEPVQQASAAAHVSAPVLGQVIWLGVADNTAEFAPARNMRLRAEDSEQWVHDEDTNVTISGAAVAAA